MITMWSFNKTLSERYSKLVKLIKSIDSHFQLTEDKEDSFRLHLPNYKGNEPMDFHIYLLAPIIYVRITTEFDGEEVSCLNFFHQDTNQQDIFNASMTNNLSKVRNFLSEKYLDDDKDTVNENNNKDPLDKANNSLGIINTWSLLAFAKAHGKMQVGDFQNKETGEMFKACVFTQPNGTRVFVAFSSKLGELTPKEIVAMKDELVVVQLESGNYCLCKTNSGSVNLDQDEDAYYIKQYGVTKDEYLKENYNEVNTLTAVCKKNVYNFYTHEDYSELEIGKTYQVTHIGVFRSSTSIMLDGFGNKAYKAVCFEIFENGESINEKYTQEQRFWAPYLREMQKKYNSGTSENNTNFNSTSILQNERCERISDYELPDGSIYNGGCIRNSFGSIELCGIGSISYTNGEKYKGEFKYGRSLGWGHYWFKNNHSHKGYFDGTPRGIGYLNEDYDMAVGNFYEGRLHGWAISFRNQCFKYGYWEHGKLVKDLTAYTLWIRYEISNLRVTNKNNLIQIGKEHDFIRFGVEQKLVGVWGFEFFKDGTVKAGLIREHKSGEYMLCKTDGTIETGKWKKNAKTSEVSSFDTPNPEYIYEEDGLDVYKNETN